MGKSGNQENPIGNRELTARIIHAAVEVHRTLGPGFLESIYEEALCVEFTLAGMGFERQRAIPITYKNAHVGEHRLDLLVEGVVIVELKAVGEVLDIHFAVVRSYMKALNLADALLLNFAAMPLGIKRVGKGRATDMPTLIS